MDTTTKAESGWRYVLVGILLFLLLGMDMLSGLVGKLLDGRSLSDPEMWSVHWYATVGTFLCSVTLWAVSSALVVAWVRRRGTFGSLFSFHRDRQVVLVFCLGIVALAIISWLESSRAGEVYPSLVGEYRAFEHRYPQNGATVVAFQYLYYILESVMVLLMIAVFQRAGEIWSRLASVPWGGFGLALTWGLAHFTSHPEGAPVVVVIALLFGFVFVGVRKSLIPSLAVIYLVFVL